MLLLSTTPHTGSALQSRLFRSVYGVHEVGLRRQDAGNHLKVAADMHAAPLHALQQHAVPLQHANQYPDIHQLNPQDLHSSSFPALPTYTDRQTRYAGQTVGQMGIPGSRLTASGGQMAVTGGLADNQDLQRQNPLNSNGVAEARGQVTAGSYQVLAGSGHHPAPLPAHRNILIQPPGTQD